VSADAFKHVAILGGGGVMGHGIALACLQGSAAKVFLAGYRGDPKFKPDSKGGWYEFLGVPRSERPK
jgi:hypothetical protein